MVVSPMGTNGRVPYNENPHLEVMKTGVFAYTKLVDNSSIRVVRRHNVGEIVGGYSCK